MTTTVNDKTTICISNSTEVEHNSKAMTDCKEHGVPVVDVEFLDDATNGSAHSKITSHIISSWGNSPRSTPSSSRSGKEETDFGFKEGKGLKGELVSVCL